MVSDLSRDVLQGFRMDSRLCRDAVAALHTKSDMDELVRFSQWNQQRYEQRLRGAGFSVTNVKISAAYLALAMRLMGGSHQWGEAFEVMISRDLFATSEDIVTAVNILYEKIQDSKAAVRATRDPQYHLPVRRPETISYNGNEYVRHFRNGQTFGAEHALVHAGMMVELGRIRSLDDLHDFSLSGAQYTLKAYWDGAANHALVRNG